MGIPLNGSLPFAGTALALPLLLLSARSEAAPLDIRKDIVYAEVDGEKLALNLYRPGGPQRAPLIVWVHGGPTSQSHRDFSRFRQYLVSKGHVVTP